MFLGGIHSSDPLGGSPHQAHTHRQPTTPKSLGCSPEQAYIGGPFLSRLRLENEILAVILVILVTGSLGVGYFAGGQLNVRTTTSTITSSQTIVVTTTVGSTPTTCIIVGQPGGIFFRVLSDSTSEPVAGVVVTAVNSPASCNGSPATAKTVYMFTTNGTEWLSLPSDNNYQYSFIANYQGHTFTFTANLEPVSLTCATLYVPSGRTNTTITEFGNTC